MPHYIEVFRSIIIAFCISGINDWKYNARARDGQKEKYEDTKNIESFEEREEIYSKNREAICEQIKNSKTVIDRVVNGFFKHRSHLHLHFAYLSGVEDLRQRIETNWAPEMAKIEKFVRSQAGEIFRRKCEQKMVFESK